jgi:hypothetical protein
MEQSNVFVTMDLLEKVSKQQTFDAVQYIKIKYKNKQIHFVANLFLFFVACNLLLSSLIEQTKAVPSICRRLIQCPATSKLTCPQPINCPPPVIQSIL